MSFMSKVKAVLSSPSVVEYSADAAINGLDAIWHTEEEKAAAIGDLGSNPEITRFKGLGEISPDEFKNFIGDDIRLEPVTLSKRDAVAELLEFYMGTNTPERQNFIIENLRIEKDLIGV